MVLLSMPVKLKRSQDASEKGWRQNGKSAVAKKKTCLRWPRNSLRSFGETRMCKRN